MRSRNRFSASMCAMIGCGAAVVCVGTARATIVHVNVFSFDFSTGGPLDPIVDPVIQVGDTVRWTFLSAFHSTTSVAGSAEQWNSDLILQPNATYDHLFTNSGTFWYYCLPHGSDNGDGTADGMSGTITVVPAPGGVVAFAGVMGASVLCGRRRGRRDRGVSERFA